MNRQLHAVGCAVVALAVAACEPKTDTSTPSGAVMAAPGPNVVVVTAKEFAFAGPDTIPAGWTTFRLVNEGAQLHHMQMVELEQGKTLGDLMAASKTPGPPPPWAVMVGGPNAPDPKGESNTTMKLEAGNYALLCFVDLPDHVPHVAKGMSKALVVTPSTGTPATEPTADVEIQFSDYKFTIDTIPKAGKVTFRVLNNGPQNHEVELIKLAPGKTLEDFGKWMQAMQGPPPATAIGGVAGIKVGGHAYFTADLTPGDYVLICFLPDEKDPKKMHLDLGMILPIKIM